MLQTEKVGGLRKLYFTAPHMVEVRHEELRIEEGAVLVESRVIGISRGTESHIWHGSFPRVRSEDGLDSLDGVMEYPLAYGYMNAGETPDGERVFGFFPHQDRFAAREEQLVHFPADTDFEDIVLYPSVETAYTAAVDAAVLPGERVLIIGQGVMGLLTAEILKDVKGVRLAAAEYSPLRAGYSRELGLFCLSPEDDNFESSMKDYLGGGADKVINFSGSAEGLQTGIDLSDFGASLIEASWYGDTETSLRLGTAFHRRRLTIKSSQVSHLPDGIRGRWPASRRSEVVRNLVLNIGPSKYINGRYRLEDAPRAFEELYSGDEVLQAVLIP